MKPRRSYITNPIIYLRDYLTLSEEDRGKELAYKYGYLFAEWAEDNGKPYAEELGENISDVIEMVVPAEDFVAFYGSEKVAVEQDAYSPTFLFMDFTEIVKNQWLIHFTDDAWGIAHKGFTQGQGDLESLGLTTHLPAAVKTGGYNFAYALDDFEHYGKDRFRYKYGNEAVMFKASGIKVYHHGDSEPQVIFEGATANSFVPIREGDSGWYVGGRPSGEPTYQNESLEAVVDWVVANYDQYRHVLANVVGKHLIAAIKLLGLPT